MGSRQYWFYKCIRKTIIQFLALFNNINIERYEQDGTVRGRYLVPIRFVPKSKAWLWAADKGKDEEALPAMAVTMTGIDFDNTRLSNRHENIRVSTNYSALTATYAKNAIPYNISFSLQIYALHNVDIDQIYEQILPYFVPHAFFVIHIPELNMDFEVKVVLNSCSPMMTDDTTEEEARVIKWETQFQVQTYLFKPISTVDLVGRIPFDTSPSAMSYTDRGVWSIPIQYVTGNYVVDNSTYYVCVSAHTSSMDNRPPNAEFWQLLNSRPAPSAWSTEDGWTGSWSVTSGEYSWYPPSASWGGVLTRLYTDEDAFNNVRDSGDIPENVFTDTAETLAIQPRRVIDVDQEAKILLDMEILD